MKQVSDLETQRRMDVYMISTCVQVSMKVMY